MRMLKIKNTSILLTTLFILGATISLLDSCLPSQKVAAKTGVQLWAENCQRCHNTPSSSTFSPEQWETVGMHMQTRALLTEDERKKIVAFLKQ